MNVRRRGFTLIEILVTIGIILVLVAIVSVGITYVTRAGKNNAVKVNLNNLRGMIAELEVSAGLAGRQPAEWAWQKNGQKQAVTAGNVWKDNDPNSTATFEPAIVPAAPVTSGSPAARFESDAVVNTQLIMQLLLAAPKNKTMLGQLPPEQLLEKVPAGGTPRLMIDNTTNRAPTPPLPLDPWGNPIIFVPASGLCGDTSDTDPDSMWVNGDGRRDSAGNKRDENAKQVVAAPSAAQVGPIRSPDNRPFWASAGPDGDFSTGDDNVYSFEN